MPDISRLGSGFNWCWRLFRRGIFSWVCKWLGVKKSLNLTSVCGGVSNQKAGGIEAQSELHDVMAYVS